MSVKVMIDPPLTEAAEVAKECLGKHKLLLLVGNCRVIYRGRANSKLDPGERIVIVKEDGALLVHRPKRYDPVNWMPGGEVSYQIKLVTPKRGANLPIDLSDSPEDANRRLRPPMISEVLQIRASRRKPYESIRIFFDSVYLLSTLSLSDAGQFSLYASEEDMQRAILLKPSIIEPGFQPITYEKKVDPGFIDVYGIDKDGKFVVVEIKRKTAGREAAFQLAKYVKSLKSIVNREVRGILAAPLLAKGVQRILVALGLDFKSLDPKKCADVLREPEAKKLEEFFVDRN
jgi:RecB family endonuclease NucS